MIEESPCRLHLTPEASEEDGRSGGTGSESCPIIQTPAPLSFSWRRMGHFLFYGNEYQDSGRASGDRVGDRDRSDQRADPHRGSGEPLSYSQKTMCISPVMPLSAGSMPRIRKRTSAHRPELSQTSIFRAEKVCGIDSGDLQRIYGAALLRLHAGES